MIARRSQKVTGLRLETLEGRMVLSSAASPTHAAVAAHVAPQAHAAPVHATAHKATAAATSSASASASAANGQILVNLTPATTGIAITSVTFDPRIHLIMVKGTTDINSAAFPNYYGFTPTYPTTAFIGVSANQAVNRFQSVAGSLYTSVSIANASVTRVPFQGRILASAGMFESGVVSISVTSSSPYYYYYGYNTLTVIARMHNAKAY